MMTFTRQRRLQNMFQKDLINNLVLVLVAIGFHWSVFSQSPLGNPSDNGSKLKFRVATYNVQNLFDHLHDTGKNDWYYLPKNSPGKNDGCNTDYNPKSCRKNDWNQTKIGIKFKQIKRVIESIGNPDVLVLTEVENKKILGELAQVLGYQGVKIPNGPDKRGIDVGVLYNYAPFNSKKEQHKRVEINFVGVFQHDVKGLNFKEKPTRPVYEVSLDIEGVPFTFFGNHWPSQHGPTKLRVAAAKTLLKAVRQTPRNRFIIATGDFNILESEKPHPVRYVTKRSKLVDLHFSRHAGHHPSQFLKGTYFYLRKGEWNIFDRFLVDRRLIEGVANKAKRSENRERFKYVKGSYTIHANDFLTKDIFYKKGSFFAKSLIEETGNPSHPLLGKTVSSVPMRYDTRHEDPDNTYWAGFSDHLPVSLEFEMTK